MPLSKDRIGLFVVLGYLLLIFFLSAIDQGGPANLSSDPAMVRSMKIMSVVTSTLVFIVPVTLYCQFLRPEKTAFLNIASVPHIYYLITAVVCIFFAFPAVASFIQLNQKIHFPESMAGIEKAFRDKDSQVDKLYTLFFADRSTMGLVINLLVMALIPAVSEEFFFRGILQQTLIKNKLNAHIAIAVTAILFSAIHMQFFGFLPRLLLGLVLGYLYYITQNLWVSILAHFFNNAFEIVMLHFMMDELPTQTTAPVQDNSGISITYALLSLALVAGQLVFLQRFVNRVKLSNGGGDIN